MDQRLAYSFNTPEKDSVFFSKKNHKIHAASRTAASKNQFFSALLLSNFGSMIICMLSNLTV